MRVLGEEQSLVKSNYFRINNRHEKNIIVQSAYNIDYYNLILQIRDILCSR